MYQIHTLAWDRRARTNARTAHVAIDVACAVACAVAVAATSRMAVVSF